MNAYLLVLAIALTAGLRTFVPVLAVRWPYANWTTWVAGLFAFGEIIADKLPNIPGRTTLAPMIFRSISGAFCAWAVGTPLGVSLPLAICFGVVGAIAGAYIGYAWRMQLAPTIKLPGLVAALIEDVVAIGVAFWVVLGAH
jgi:uncharacterized membrane protein